MFKGTGFFFISIVIVYIAYAVTGFHLSFKLSEKGGYPRRLAQPQNHPPVVKIIAPKNNSVYEGNTQVHYEISVSDKEDGESKYQEINPKEVFLEIKYVADTSGMTASQQKNQKDPPGLAAIKTSNCMNCHTFKSKLIGPSFYDISKRYPHIKSSTDTLKRHIREGSTGRWGTVKMPSNKELTAAQAQNIVDWIFENAANPNLNYYAGTAGSFRLVQPAASKKGAFILTASYTDHGLKDNPDQSLEGQDVIIINAK